MAAPTLDKEMLPREATEDCTPARCQERFISCAVTCGAYPLGLTCYTGTILDRYDRSCLPEQLTLKQRIREIAEARVRYGYRRIWIASAGKASRSKLDVYRLDRNKG
jgi:hypothetical protein